MPTIEELPDTPSTPPPARPQVDVSPDRTKGHRRKASLVSPVAITASSPAARRMSRRGTPQAALLDGQTRLQKLADDVERAAGLVGAAILSWIVLAGTLYAQRYSLALNTSFSLLPAIERTAYFARKSNPFNQYGVKLSWLHTSIAYLLHLITSPPSTYTDAPPALDAPKVTLRSPASTSSPRRTRLRTRSKRSRLWTYLLTSALWFAFTSWFFGYGVGDRVIQLSGGQCVVPIPPEWEIERDGVQAVLSHVPISVGAYMLPEEASREAADVTKDTDLQAGKDMSGSIKVTVENPSVTVSDRIPSDPILLGVPPYLCVERQPLSPKRKEHRDIFAILTHLPFPNHLRNKGTGSPAGLTIPRPRWYKGHDISGHAVALIVASLLLIREVAPTWARWIRGIDAVLLRNAEQATSPSFIAQTSARGDLRELAHGLATVLASALLGLWVFMLAMTAVYFHSPEEKFSGLALGLGISLLTYLLSPGPSPRTHSSSVLSTASIDLPSAISDSDDDVHIQAAKRSGGAEVADENTARRLAAAAMQKAEAEAEEQAQAAREAKEAVQREMDAVLAGKEKVA